jgi:hypothetical protein
MSPSGGGEINQTLLYQVVGGGKNKRISALVNSLIH